MKVPRWSSVLRPPRRPAAPAWWGLLPLLLLLTAATPILAAQARAAETIPAPRPLSAAEQQAVNLALAYLDAGAEAWIEHLDGGSPLARLEREAALAEIGVRTGPAQGAAWRLQTTAPGEPEGRVIFTIDFPSGLSESLTMDLTRGEDGAGPDWRIHRLRSLVDPWHEPKLDWDLEPEAGAATEADGGSVPGAGPPAAFPARPPSLFASVALALAVLTLAVFALAGPPRTSGLRPGQTVARATGALPLLLPLLVAAGLLLSCGKDEATDSPSNGAADRSAADFTLLGELLPLRRATALDGNRGRVAELAEGLPTEGPLRVAADLWRAELALDQSEVTAARDLLDGVPAEAAAPLAGLLRARLAFVEGEEAGTAQAYDLAGDAGPDHDGFRLEVASAFAVSGFEVKAEAKLELLAEMGSRSADVYYGQARLDALRGNPERGEAYLRQAWELRPVERSMLLSDPLLASLLARPTIFPMFDLSSPAEPVSRSPEAGGGAPLTLPAGAEASLSGSLLQVDLAPRDDAAGDPRPASLTVPGGAALAPHGTRLLAADGLRKQQEARVLARLADLMAVAGDVSALAQPRRRDDFVHAGEALAQRNRWRELDQLTSGLTVGELGLVPAELVHLRAAALSHLDRGREARDLLVRRASADLAKERRDPASFYHLAELVAAEGEHELAIRLLQRADQLSPLGGSDQRIRQLRMQKRLADDHQTLETDHFRLVYPRLTGKRYPRQLGTILEAELERIQRWIPYQRDGELIEVQLYPMLEFFRAYSTSALVLGLYDGVVRVPFADLRSLDPELVAVLSHELGHAMIGRATDEQAPKWFHEGLAVHVQMKQRRANPIPDLDAAGRVIAFPVIEPILAGFAEGQLIDLAYSEAAWVVHYFEAEHGIASLSRFLDAFRRGDTTPEAVERVLGMSPAELDRSFRRWAMEEAPRAWPSQVRRYDRELDVPFERSEAPRPARRAERRAPERDQHREQMRRWHRFYAGRMVELKGQLGKLAADLQRGSVGQRRLACDGLAREAEELLQDRRVFATPGSDAGAHLRRAVDHFRRAARACSQGDGRTASGHYRQAEGALGQAAAELRPYGLRP